MSGLSYSILPKMTISEYLQIHDAALLDAAAFIGLRGRAAASPGIVVA